MVVPGSILADIGTDHALLPAALVKRGICPKAYAGDVAEGPLQSARKTLAEEDLLDRVIPVLSDGFERIPGDADCAVIAGMGFRTAAMILDNAADRLHAFRRIIVQVNNEAPAMRQYISDRHWEIMDECYVADRGKDYEIIVFRTADHPAYTAQEIFLGPCLMRQRDEAWLRYCMRLYRKVQSVNVRRKECGKEADPEYVFAEQCLEEYLGV